MALWRSEEVLVHRNSGGSLIIIERVLVRDSEAEKEIKMRAIFRVKGFEREDTMLKLSNDDLRLLGYTLLSLVTDDEEQPKG